MQQTLNCPSCGSPITDSQQFCGICGTQLLHVVQEPEIMQPVQTVPDETTSAPVVGDISQTTPDTQYVAASAPMAGTAPPVENRKPATRDTSSSGWSEVGSPRKTGILRVAGVILLVIGWIVLIVGSLASIAMAVFAFMGGQLVSLIPGIGNLGGNEAITVGVIGLVLSLVFGFGLIALSEISFTVIDTNKAVRLSR
jgi:hypothetical protein